MKKRIFSALLALCMMLTALPLTGLTAFAAGITSGDFEYEILSETDKTCEITGYTGSATEIVIPSELDGYTVTEIGPEAFYGCTSLINVTIPNGATHIGHGTFGNCTSLVSINIPNSVTSIEAYAFQNCTSLKNVTIPDEITHIEHHTFAYCSSLVNISLPNSVTRIEDEAFRDCVSLTSITLPNSVTNIGSSAFYNTAYYNNDANWEDGVLYIGNHCIKAKDSISGAYTIKLGTKTIADSAFYDCKQLNEITLSNSVIHIGYSAFWECETLTNIMLPNTLIDIGTSAFADTAYYNNDANWEDGVLYIGNHCIEAKSNISGAYTIKSSTISVASGAFSYCYSLTSIDIPNSVTHIGGSAFSDCDSLTSIVIPDSVTSIGDRAFNWCTSLTSIVIPDSVASIGEYAFYSCTSLTSIDIPASVTSIGEGAFQGCDNLTIYGYAGSYAETYAAENSIPFVALVTAEDMTSGIIVMETTDGVLSEDTELNVEQTESTEMRVSYNITLVQNGAEIQPAGTVTVKIPVPDGMDGRTCKVYREEADGTYTDMNAVYQDGYMVFTTDHFSVYVG